MFVFSSQLKIKSIIWMSKKGAILRDKSYAIQ